MVLSFASGASGESGLPQLVGVLGGSFDPVHTGHLIIAEEARVRLGLERVLFVPAGVPYLKAGQVVASAPQRLRMVELAISANPAFKASAVDLERPGPTYTVDTLAALRPLLGQQAQIFFLVGWDILASLPVWREPEKLLELCHLVGIPRPGFPRPDLEKLARAMPGTAQRILLLEGPCIGISSTEIRDRVARGLSIRYLVPEAVERYIVEQGLYGATRNS